MRRTRKTREGVVWMSGLTLAAAAVLAFAWMETRAQPPGASDMRTVTGTIRRFTTAPRGEVDGAVLDDGTVIHWPPHLQERFKDIAARGERIRVSGRMETGPEGDTHLEIRAITNVKTKASARNDDDGPPPPPPGREPRGKRGRRGTPPAPPRDTERKTVTGTIKSFTTAPRGETDGAVLEDGTVIHWPPHLQDRFKDIAARGERVRATGWMETGPEGDTHLEVRDLTNLRVKGDALPPPDVRRSNDRDGRIRDLEHQVEQLRREVERLRRERK